MKKIKSKLIVLITILILVPVFVLGFISFKTSEKLLINNFESSSKEINKNLSEFLLSYLNSYKNGLTLLSINYDFKQIDQHPEYEPYIESLLKNYYDATPGIDAAYFGRTNKDLYLYPQTDLGADFDVTTRDWYKNAVEKNEFNWSNAYKSAANNQMNITASIPVYSDDSNTNLVGVVGVDVPLNDLSEKINDVRVGKRGYSFVIDKNQNIVAHKDKSKYGKTLEIPEIKNELAKNKDGIVEYIANEDGKKNKKIALFHTVPNLDWVIVTSTYADDLYSETKSILKTSILTGIFMVTISIFVGILFARKLTKPLKTMIDFTKKISEGDFTCELNIKTNDEIELLASSFNLMSLNMKELISETQLVSNLVSEASNNLFTTSQETNASAVEILKTIEEISKGAQQQAEDTESSVGLSMHLDEKINNLSQNTEFMIKDAINVMKTNESGIKSVEILKHSNIDTNNSIEEISIIVSTLNDKIKNIDDILKTISAISQQTNLLSLNASIEAARAGEAGRGFAVVADEIRQLAEGSAKAAKHIKEIIENIQKEANLSVESMNTVKNISRKQNESVNDVSNSFIEISKAIENITSKINEMESSVISIGENKSDMIHSLENISAISQQTAAASQEVCASVDCQSNTISKVASSAENLNELSNKLNLLIGKFKI